MLNFLTTSKEPNLSRAGSLLVIEIVMSVALAFVLSQLGLPAENAVFVSLLLFNLLTAYYLAKAAQAQGKNALFYGLISLLPPGAFFSFFSLRNNERLAD